MKKIIRKRGFKYLMAFLIPALMLLSMTIKPMMTNVLGEEIVLKTMPFDPRDIFRGDYVQLDYEISEIPLEKLDKEILDMKQTHEYDYIDFVGLENKDIYVVLKKEGEFYIVERATLKEPNEGTFLKGKYRYPLYREPSRELSEEEYIKEEKYHHVETRGIKVGYTLDKYYVPENTGMELEEASRKGEMLARVKIYKGYSLLKQVLNSDGDSFAPSEF